MPVTATSTTALTGLVATVDWRQVEEVNSQALEESSQTRVTEQGRSAKMTWLTQVT